MRLIHGCVALVIAVHSPAHGLTLFNSKDPKTESSTSRASEALNNAFSRMFEVLAAVERRSFEDADKMKGTSIEALRASARLFIEVSKNAVWRKAGTTSQGRRGSANRAGDADACETVRLCDE